MHGLINHFVLFLSIHSVGNVSERIKVMFLSVSSGYSTVKPYCFSHSNHNVLTLFYYSCNQCGRESKLLSKFYELELNIQGHKQLTDCISEFLKVLRFWHICYFCSLTVKYCSECPFDLMDNFIILTFSPYELFM